MPDTKRRVGTKAVREKSIARYARKTGALAAKKAARKKMIITVAKGGRIYKIHPNGVEEKGKALPKRVSVKNQVIKIN
jgi:hypothetical protein